ncbi:MAG TPA: hypothetical protein VH092_13265 [Urbifossiella sp.]|nr:hypothetical protein [Urbifossiella sp.]
MAGKSEPLKFGQGATFAKPRLKRLPQEDDTWEADFQALPKPITESTTRYLGVVVAAAGGAALATSEVAGRPSANDLAELLARAMREPAAGTPHRPRHVHVRGHPQWRELFPHLGEIGLDVSVRRDLPAVMGAYQDHLNRLREARRARMPKPSAGQATVEALFPTIAKWVGGYGHIEIGDQEEFGFVVRALDHGGLVFEDDKAETLAEAMATLERGLAAYIRREGLE